MLNITNIESIIGKHFGDREMRVWHVYDVMIGSYYYHFYVENNMDKAWFRLDRNPDRVGSYMLLKGTDTKGNSMTWIKIDDINALWNLCTKFSELI